ncbi:hypothetical protein ILUMI_06529, partial [Ignelater luminosus]
MARAAFMKMKNFVTSKDLNLEIRTRIVRYYVFTILLYGMKVWKRDIDKNPSLRTLGIPPNVELKTNEEVLRQTRQLAFDYACAIQKKVPKNWTKNKIALKDWLRGFLSRQPQLSIRTPEATSLSRATSFNRKNVRDCFGNFKTVYERYQFNEDFLCSSVTDRFDTATITPGIDNVSTKHRTPSQTSAEQLLTEENQNQVDPASSNNMAASRPFQLESPIRNPTEEDETITPDSVRPYPKAGSRKPIGMKRKKGKTRILTDTPEKRLIEIAEQERQKKLRLKKTEKITLKGEERKELVEELTSNGEKNRKMSSDDDIENDSLSDKTFVGEDFDEDDVIDLDRNFQVNDFVLVKFDTKKDVYHYVGRVEE